MNFSSINRVFHHVRAFSRIDILKQYTILSFSTLLCIHAVCTVLWGPVVILVVSVGHCACVCMSDAVTQQGVTALSDSPPHGPVCLPTSQPNLTFTSILVLHTCTDVAPI